MAPLLESNLFIFGSLIKSGVVNQTIEPAEFHNYFFDRRFHAAFFADVATYGQRAYAMLGNLSRRFLRLGMGAQVGNRHIGASFCQLQCTSAANALGSAGA